MVAEGADRDHLDSLSEEQFGPLVSLAALTHADQLRELFPDGADAALAVARETTGLTDKALRTVTLPDGPGVLVDVDSGHTDDEIRNAQLEFGSDHVEPVEEITTEERP